MSVTSRQHALQIGPQRIHTFERRRGESVSLIAACPIPLLRPALRRQSNDAATAGVLVQAQTWPALSQDQRCFTHFGRLGGVDQRRSAPADPEQRQSPRNIRLGNGLGRHAHGESDPMGSSSGL